MAKRKNTKKPKATPARAKQKNTKPSQETSPPSNTRLPVKLKTKTNFPIIGIGASAGGLEAYEVFFKAMPSNSGMAFVLITHLDPTHESLLSNILQKSTAMLVLQVTDGTTVKPNTVYVIPPNKTLSILNGTLLLNDLPQPHVTNFPIDTFFSSLSQDQGQNAIGIILSGNGTDGTRGLKDIKAELGMVMVQSEESAKFKGMPHSAITTKLVDYILPPENMPNQLIAYTKLAKTMVNVPNHEVETIDLQKILELVRTRTQHDFSDYKKKTIYRRIERRMHIHQIDDMSVYVRYLQETPDEIDILFKELLIGVTHFFRDPQAFDILKKKVLLEQLAQRQSHDIFRVWVPGCSSGEEAYSITILLKECLTELNCHVNLQVFGTDIDPNAIEKARRGVYPNSISANVSPERLIRYFDKKSDAFQIKKDIRDILVFAPQNVIKDPPFTKLDLICCRNLLIYLNTTLQQKLLPLFHYSLKNNGTLFLGSSETIGQQTDLFDRIDKKWKLFKRKSLMLSIPETLSFTPTKMADNKAQLKEKETTKIAEELNLLQFAQTILEESNVSPSAIIDRTYNIVYIHGRTGKFLEPAPGKTSANILEMARVGLKKELLTAIHEVENHQKPITHKNVKVNTNGSQVTINLIVRPILRQTTLNGFMMVTFEELSDMGEATQDLVSQKTTDSTIDVELQHTKETLQLTIEELETSNEELKSTNEELQSTNEELQSTNEELETSKEELQSLHEESETVNTELQGRIEELSTAHDDMTNLLDSTHIATLFLDTNLCVHRFTPKTTGIIPLSHTDMKRPISHFAHNLIDIDFVKCATQVLSDLTVIECEVKSKNNQFFTMHIRPYRTTQNVIDGVVITFTNITERKVMEEKLRLSELSAQAALKMLPANITVAQVDKDLRYTWIYNPFPGFEIENILGKRDDEISSDGGSVELLELKRNVLKNGNSETKEITFSHLKDVRTYKIVAEPLQNGEKEIVGITTSAIYISKT